MSAVGYTSGDPRKLNRGGYAFGEVVAADGTGTLVPVPAGADTEVLTADSTEPAGVDWETGGGGGGGTPANTVVTETSFGQASTAGISAAYSRGDHTHGTPAAPSVPSAAGTVTSETTFGQAASAGAAATYSRGDHTHGTPAAPSVPSAAVTVALETSFGQAAVTGTATRYAREDHSHGTPSVTPLTLPNTTTPAAPVNAVSIFARDDQGHAGLYAIGPNGNEFDVLHDTWLVVRNNTGSIIPKGTPVYFTGIHPGGDTPTVSPARANAAGTMPAFGLALNAISPNAFGRIVHHGYVRGVDTSTYAINDQLYVSAATAGLLTNVPPAPPNLSEAVAFVERVHATEGVLHVTVRATFGAEQGTNSNTWDVGSGTAGVKSVRFNNGSVCTLQANPTGARTVTIPDASGTLVLETRSVTASGTYLLGGGDLSADRVISANVGTTAGTLAAGDHTHGGGGGSAPVFVREYRTSGDISPGNDAAFTIVAGLSLSLPAVEGDNVELQIGCLINPGTNLDFWDPCVIVSGAAVRYASTNTGTPSSEGDCTLYPAPSNFRSMSGVTFSFTVGAGDLDGGNVVFGIAHVGPGSTGTPAAKIYANTTQTFRWRAVNYGQ